MGVLSSYRLEGDLVREAGDGGGDAIPKRGAAPGWPGLRV